MSETAETLERAHGRSGELVLRRAAAGLEIIAGGVFLVSAANAASSRALVSAAWPQVAGDSLRVLIGGLGLGDALDEALAEPRVTEVVVAELEPAVAGWFHAYGGPLAARAAIAEAAGRARIDVADVADVLAATPAAWDVVALDTDNGPEWLVRDENSILYGREGLQRARTALRRGGVVVVWSPDRYAAFEHRFAEVFPRVTRAVVHDVVGRYRHEYTMYVGARDG